MKKTKQTKFPVARIKKIMQTDEDVGKVAMATPVLVSKALELFMASLVGAAADETRAANSKKMTPYHLKRTILNTPMFDFLHEQVSSIPDPVASTSTPVARKQRGRKKAPKASSSGGSSDEESSDDERAHRPAAPARKRAKVEVPSVFGIAPPLPPPATTGGPAYGLPMVAPGLPPVPGPSAAVYGAGASGIKREDSESESGSEEDDDDE